MHFSCVVYWTVSRFINFVFKCAEFCMYACTGCYCVSNNYGLNDVRSILGFLTSTVAPFASKIIFTPSYFCTSVRHRGWIPHSLSFSFFSISFSSLTIFFSIPQAAENSPFSSFLSSLAYLLSTGLTTWNFDLACLSFIIHSISFILEPFICSTRFNFMFVI